MKNNPAFRISCPMSLLIILGLLFTYSFAGPVSHFGALEACKINGKGNLCGKKTGTSTPVFVKGPSLFWSDGSGSPYYNVETVDWLVDNFQIGIIRAAMAIRYYGDGSKGKEDEVNQSGGTPGYYFNKDKQKSFIKAVIDAAILNDIYVIVDWHSHVAHNETNDAKDFFVEMANAYPNVPNIIWEVYNEPMSTSTDNVTNHANTIISALRAAGNTNLVLIGSPSWSSQPKEQSSKWGESSSRDKNVAFTFHFYSVTHGFNKGSGYAKNAIDARDAGYAIFGSEWGGTNADGQGSFVGSSADGWTDWMDTDKISNCMWSASDAPKDNNYNATEEQASAMFKRGTTPFNLAESRLSASGQYFKTYMSKNNWTTLIPSGNPKGNDVSVSVKDGESITLDTKLGLTGKVTGVSKPDFGTVEFTDNSIKYTTSASGSPQERVRFTYEITNNNVKIQQRITVTITNRQLILPDKGSIAVSHKAPTTLRAVQDLSASDPNNPISPTLSFKEATLSDPSKGEVSIKKDTLIFTPAKGIVTDEVTLTYTIQNAEGSFRSASAILKLKNFAPTLNTSIVNNCCAGSKANTDPIGLGVKQMGAQDKDGDSLWFDTLYLDSKFPGRLEKVKADSFVYYPEENKTGRVVFLSVVTDGELYSNMGKSALNLTGGGTSIGTITPPDNIPGYEVPTNPGEPVPIISPNLGKNFAIRYSSLGNVEINFAQSGFAKLDVYSLSGKKMGSLLNGYQNAGSKTVSLKSLNLQKGVYVLRLSQGSQVKTLRVVN